MRTQVLVAIGLSVGAAPTAIAAEYGDMIGIPSVHITAEPDTLVELAQRYRVGFVELRAANPSVDSWVPGAGRKLNLPTSHLLPSAPRRGIVVNLGDLRLYHFADDGEIRSYSVGIGRSVSQTPEGTTHVIARQVDPTWFPPPSIRSERPALPAAIPPGPANPLGSRAIYLGLERYVIHGTNRPAGVGRRVSHGCIRMYEEDIGELYERIAFGTPVSIIREEVKLGWSEGELYLEAHPPENLIDKLEEMADVPSTPAVDIQGRILDRIRGDGRRIDWATVEQAMHERTGLPVRITRGETLLTAP